MSPLPNRMIELLNEHGMTMSDLARKLECSTSYISRLSRGDRQLQIPMLIKIMDVFECEAVDVIPLLQRDSSRNKQKSRSTKAS